MEAQLHTCSGVTIERNSSSDGSLTSRRKIQQPLSEPLRQLVTHGSCFTIFTYRLAESQPSVLTVCGHHFHVGLEMLDAPTPS